MKFTEKIHSKGRNWSRAPLLCCKNSNEGLLKGRLMEIDRKMTADITTGGKRAYSYCSASMALFPATATLEQRKALGLSHSWRDRPGSRSLYNGRRRIWGVGELVALNRRRRRRPFCFAFGNFGGRWVCLFGGKMRFDRLKESLEISEGFRSINLCSR